MATIWMVVLGVVVVGALAGRKTIGRVLTSISAQFNKAGRAAISADPIAVLQKQIDDSTTEIEQGSAGLVSFKGLVAQYTRKVESGVAEVATWDSRARGYVDQKNDLKAGEALSKKKAAEEQLASDKKQLATYETSYNTNLKKVQYANGKIAQAKERARSLAANLKLSKTEAAVAELAKNFNVGTSSLGKMSEVEDEINRQIDENRAKASVATDLGSDGMADIEAEEAARNASVADDLAKLKAEMGK